MRKPAILSMVFIICLNNSFAQNWGQMGADIDGEAAGDLSGNSVSMSSDGNSVAVGALTNGGNGTHAGYVRVYSWSDSVWTQNGLDIDGEAAGDRSGNSVSMSSDGNTVAIGAVNNDGNGADAGHVRVYSWSGQAWTQKGSDIDGEAAGDRSGNSVSMSSDGNSVAVGAYGNDGNGKSAGHVRVYSWSGQAWTQKGSDIDGEAAGDRSGQGMSMSSDGNSVAVGAYGNGIYAGHVRVFTWSGSAWKQKGSDIDGEAANDQSGYGVIMSSDGSTLAVGALGNDGNGTLAGHVRVFSWSGSDWSQKGLDIDGEAAYDLSGQSVSMGSDGNAVAIGAQTNDANGTDAGHVRVYSWSGQAWTQKGSDIDGEAAGDRSGISVSMSSGGNSVAIGAYGNDGNGTEAGHVRVYRFGWLVGINSITTNSAKIYPNPSANNFTLNLGQSHQGIELKITDVLGQIVSTEKVESASEVEFEIAGNKGVYLVEISTSEGFLTTVKVIKE